MPRSTGRRPGFFLAWEDVDLLDEDDESGREPLIDFGRRPAAPPEGLGWRNSR